MKWKYISVLILLSTIIVKSHASDLHYITNRDGLSNSSINCMYQDSLGLLWIGTWDGLNMYNSMDFKVFKPDLSANSISNNIIRNILEERLGILWIATDYGINRYDAITDEFRTYFCSNTKKSVFLENSFHICKDSRNRIFSLVNEYGFFWFDQAGNEFISLEIDFRYNLKAMFFDNHDALWFLSEQNELYRMTFVYQPDHIAPTVNSIRKIVTPDILAAFYDPSSDRIWMQTTENTLIRMCATTEHTEVLLTDFASVITDIQFQDEQCWIGTLHGLYKYAGNQCILQSELSEIQILSILEGNQDILWIGTGARGVIRKQLTGNNFNAYTLNNTDYQSIAPVRTFMEDNDHTLYIGTKWKGLYIVEDRDNPTGAINFTTENGLSHNTINALGMAGNNIIWICSEGYSVNYIDVKSKQIKTLEARDKFNLEGSFSIYVQNDTTLWVGTNGLGFYKIIVDTKTDPFRVKSYKQYSYKIDDAYGLNNNIVYSIIPYGNDQLWIGTRGGGLNLFHIENETFTRFQHDGNDPYSISNDDVICLYTDRKGYLWVGTSIGLNRVTEWKNDRPLFERYTETEGIPNNTIHGILEDKNGFIWISTNKGLAQLQPDRKKIISYIQADGLQDNEFSDGAYYRSPYSELFYFGGISGYTCFHPDDITQNNYFPILYLADFHINNRRTTLNQYNYRKEKNETLKMGYDDKFFSMHFIPVDYINNTKCDLVYKLENHDKEWINIGPSRTIVYSNLPAGHYMLRAKCRNAAKEWSHEFSIPIHIFPPWWTSWYAIWLYTIIIATILYLIYRNSKNKVKMQHQLQLKTLENKKNEEIHQAKLRFFTNIAHEFSNSLTLIYGPCEQLLRKIHNDMQNRKYLHVIQANAERMQRLIQQLMEFRKAETGYLDLQIKSVNISELVNYTVDNFVDMADEKNIHLNIQINPDENCWNTDRGAFEKIIFNLLSNAFKYTPENGYINLEINNRNDLLTLIITNSGRGIKEEDKSLIFNRFKILDSFESQVLKGVETRTGIGLALCKTLVDLLKGTIEIESEVDKFASFIIRFPFLEISPIDSVCPAQNNKWITSINDQNETSKEPNSYKQESATTYDSAEKQTLLIIDDDRAILDLLSDILSPHFTVYQAIGGIEALNILQNTTPQLIICDIIMPEMNGFEFLEALKKNDLNVHIPVILLSSNSSIESQIKGIKTGADVYLSKPFHAEHLKAIINQLLSHKEDMKKYLNSPISVMEQIEGKTVHKEEKDFMLKLTNLISENISDENFSLELLAQKMGISKIQLYRKIKDIKNITPTEYIREIRFAHAEKLLKTTNKTVQEIMYLCGFNNKAHFYRQFAKKYNQTPKEFRNSFLKKEK